MAKLPVTVVVFRSLQLALGLAFVVFWAWACAAKYAVGGGAGEYSLGFLAAIASIAVCFHGIWSFAKKKHLVEHSATYHNLRWAADLGVVALWLGTILINLIVPIPRELWHRELGGSSWCADPHRPDCPSPSGSDPIVVVGMGVNVTELFSVITFFMTALLLVLPAVRARRTGTTAEATRKDQTEGAPVAHGIQTPQAAYVARHSGENRDSERHHGSENERGTSNIEAPQPAHVVDI